MNPHLLKHLKNMNQLELISFYDYQKDYFPEVDSSMIYFEGFYYSDVQNVTLELIYYPESEIYQFYTEIEGKPCLFNFTTYPKHLGKLVYLGR